MNDAITAADQNPATSTEAEPVADQTAAAAVEVSDDTTAAGDDTAAEETTEASPASREAAKYRRRLRETETQRDQLAERLSVLQRAEAERIAAEHLADGADIFRDGASIESLLDDDGNVDPVKVTELAAATAAAHPHWIKRALPPVIRRNDLASGASSRTDQSAPSWQQVLRRASK